MGATGKADLELVVTGHGAEQDPVDLEGGLLGIQELVGIVLASAASHLGPEPRAVGGDLLACRGQLCDDRVKVPEVDVDQLDRLRVP